MSSALVDSVGHILLVSFIPSDTYNLSCLSSMVFLSIQWEGPSGDLQFRLWFLNIQVVLGMGSLSCSQFQVKPNIAWLLTPISSESTLPQHVKQEDTFCVQGFVTGLCPDFSFNSLQSTFLYQRDCNMEVKASCMTRSTSLCSMNFMGVSPVRGAPLSVFREGHSVLASVWVV